MKTVVGIFLVVACAALTACGTAGSAAWVHGLVDEAHHGAPRSAEIRPDSAALSRPDIPVAAALAASKAEPAPIVVLDDRQTIRNSMLPEATHGETRLAGDTAHHLPPTGLFVSLEAIWSKDFLVNARRAVDGAACGVQTYGRFVDLGVSVRYYSGDQFRGGVDKPVPSVLRDPSVYYFSIGRFRRSGILLYGGSMGLAVVQAREHTDGYFEQTNDGFAFVRSRIEELWSSGLGANAFIGLTTGDGLAAGIDGSFMNSALGTYISTGLKVMMRIF